MPSIDRGYKTDPSRLSKMLGSESEYTREPQAKLGKYEIASASYPANNQNDHFVRFYINIDDESRLIRDGKVTVVGDADRTDQNRASRGNTSQTRFNAVSAASGFVGGAVTAGQLTSAGRNPEALINKLEGWHGKAGRSVTNFAANKPWAAKAIAGVGGAAVGWYAANTLNVTKTLKKLGATITLYTPTNIVANYAINWEGHDSDIADMMAADRGEEFLTNMGSSTKDGLSTKIVRMLATNASKDIQLLTRTSKNAKKDFLFKDVAQRTFNFHYNFAPQTPKEAEEVARIIYMFKLFSHPELISGYDNFLYLYPAEFDIIYGFKQLDQNGNELGSLEQENPYLHKISSCVLRAMTVNYAPGHSFQTLRRGEPCMLTMELAFAEIESLHQGRIEQGY